MLPWVVQLFLKFTVNKYICIFVRIFKFEETPKTVVTKSDKKSTKSTNLNQSNSILLSESHLIGLDLDLTKSIGLVHFLVLILQKLI